MTTPMKQVGPVDAADTPAESHRAARAWRTGLRDGQAGEAKRAAVRAEVFKRELSAALGQLGDALLAKDEAAAITWYGCLTRMASAPADK